MEDWKVELELGSELKMTFVFIERDMVNIEF